MADKTALSLADYVVTEAGFGSDMGLEKFVDIKSRKSGDKPSCVVLVATVRALKMHSGNFKIVPGKPLAKGLVEENLVDLEAGLVNLGVHIENAKNLDIPVVVAINKFPTDTAKELQMIIDYAIAQGADDAEISTVHTDGGTGGLELAKATIRACQKKSDMKFLYEDEATLKEKIETIAKNVYRAGSVEYSETASKQLEALQLKYGKLPICVAKTPLSLSADPTLKGAPSGFVLPVSEVKVSAGAGFVYLLTGKVMTMPGLGSNPSYHNIDIDENGEIVGLF